MSVTTTTPRSGRLRPAEGSARHLRIMTAIRSLPAPTVAEPTPWAPGERWRYLRHEHRNRLRAQQCQVCRGSGVLQVYIDRPGQACPTCQIDNPFANPEE